MVISGSRLLQVHAAHIALVLFRSRLQVSVHHHTACVRVASRSVRL